MHSTIQSLNFRCLNNTNSKILYAMFIALQTYMLHLYRLGQSGILNRCRRMWSLCADTGGMPVRGASESVTRIKHKSSLAWTGNRIRDHSKPSRMRYHRVTWKDWWNCFDAMGGNVNKQSRICRPIFQFNPLGKWNNRSRFILSVMCIELKPIHAKRAFTSTTVNTFNVFLAPPPWQRPRP